MKNTKKIAYIESDHSFILAYSKVVQTFNFSSQAPDLFMQITTLLTQAPQGLVNIIVILT